MDVGRILVAILLPLLGVFVQVGIGLHFWLNILLTLLGYVPGIFCDPHTPWQKGGIENAIGRMRRFMPRKTDLDTLTQQRFNDLLCAYNNTLRKCLAYKTPTELFINQLLHFKCESTCQPPLG